jgi:flagellar hook-length control protein FliK
MTTDRTAAPTRSTALADRPASGAGRTPAPPTDMFSTLLGAATPKKSDAPVRRDDNPANRRDDDHGRAGKQRRSDDSHRAQRADDKHAATSQADDTPAAADAPDSASDAAQDPVADEKPTAPSIFTLQLASPLPPQAPPAGETPGPEPTLPAFAGQVPASVAAATTAQTTVSAEVTTAAATAATAAAAAAAATTATAAATAKQGAIALEGLPAEATTDTALPAGIDLTRPQAPTANASTAPAQDPATLPSSAQQNPADAQSQGQPQPQDQASNTPSQPTTAAAQAAKPADAPAPVATQPVATNPIAPSTAPAMPSLPNVERAVPLSRAVATTGVMVHMMTDKGVNHARLNLKPAELGGIEVRLRSTSAGIHAMLVADSPEAARMLASAGDDLKRQLEDKNVNLLSLDVSTSDKRKDQPAGFSTDGFGEDRYGRGQNQTRSSANESALLMEAPASAETTLVLPDGVHVDVLA